MTKRVAVVGGGLSGVLTAKSLLDVGIAPTVFESTKVLGGMWNPGSSRCWGGMRTNLTRFACSFSDFPWESKSSLFASQEEVSRYINRYVDHHDIRSRCNLLFGCKVKKVIKNEDGKFEIQFLDDSLHSSSQIFDDVVVTSGFFSSSRMPSLPGQESFRGKVMHSDNYSLHSDFKGKRVAVVGASFSSSEIASEIAVQASMVYNIVPSAPWILPRFLPRQPDSPSTSFVPLDLQFYARERNQVESVRAERILPTPVDFLRSNNYMRSLYGAMNTDPMAAFRQEAQYHQPAFVGISDQFAGFVRSKKIQLVQGRAAAFGVDSLEVLVPREEADQMAATTANESTTSVSATTLTAVTLSDIDAVVFCTGYSPDLSFLPAEALLGMEYAPTDCFSPLVLFKDVLHPTCSGLYFAGMYRGPYFAVVELQSSLVASWISAAVPLPSPETLLEGVEAARLIRSQSPRPQFPHGDYVGLLDSYAAWLDRLPEPMFREERRLVLPAQYQSDIEVAKSVTEEAEALIAHCEAGHYVAWNIHRSLLGNWKFSRTLTSQLDSAPSGTVTGSVQFIPTVTPDPLSAAPAVSCATGACSTEEARASVREVEAGLPSLDFAYIESGQFRSNKGFTFDVTAAYVYAYNPQTDSLDIFFPASPGESPLHSVATRGRLFVSLSFQKQPSGWTSEYVHYCGDDIYRASFRFSFDGMEVKEFMATYDVTGPHKNYKSETLFERA